MINIKYNLDRREVKINGHAQAGGIGKDVICAGVSALFDTLCITLKDAELKDILKPNTLSIEVESGKAFVKCEPKDEYISAIDTVYMTIFNGFDFLAKTYPKTVSFKPMK